VHPPQTAPLRSFTIPLPLTSSLSLRDRELVLELGPPSNLPRGLTNILRYNSDSDPEPERSSDPGLATHNYIYSHTRDSAATTRAGNLLEHYALDYAEWEIHCPDSTWDFESADSCTFNDAFVQQRKKLTTSSNISPNTGYWGVFTLFSETSI